MSGSKDHLLEEPRVGLEWPGPSAPAVLISWGSPEGKCPPCEHNSGHCPLTPALMSDCPGRISKQPIPMPAPASHTQGSVVHLSDTR